MLYIIELGLEHWNGSTYRNRAKDRSKSRSIPRFHASLASRLEHRNQHWVEDGANKGAKLIRREQRVGHSAADDL